MFNFIIFYETLGLPGEPNIDFFILNTDSISSAYYEALNIFAFFSKDFDYRIVSVSLLCDNI